MPRTGRLNLRVPAVVEAAARQAAAESGLTVSGYLSQLVTKALITRKYLGEEELAPTSGRRHSALPGALGEDRGA